MPEGGLLGPPADLVDHQVGKPDGVEAVHDHGSVAKWDNQRAGIATPGVQRDRADLGQPAARLGAKPAVYRGPGAVGHHIRQATCSRSTRLATGAMGTSAGVASSALDSYTPVGGLTALGPILLGEISPGGVGSGLYAILVYAYASAANGNGSAFAGLAANTTWYNTTLGLVMLAGRYLTIVPVLALAGSLVRARVHAPSAATLPTARPVFVSLHLGVILLLGGLSYLPMLVLGLVGESSTT